MVVPVFDEAGGLPALFARLYAVLDGLGLGFELIFVDDGSRDRSAELLAAQYRRRPDVTRVVFLRANAGQHLAILAGFALARGERVVTLDADLQNPPEEIPRLLAKLDQGYDAVGGVRVGRRDATARRWLSAALNRLRARLTGVAMRDHGCMLRAYARPVVDAVNLSVEARVYLPLLAHAYARHPVEIEVAHAPRAAGRSRYTPGRLIGLGFDLLASTGVFPLRPLIPLGALVTLGGVGGAAYGALHLLRGEGAVGLLTGAAFALAGIGLGALGVLGELAQRAYLEMRGRPRYVVEAVLGEALPDEPGPLPGGEPWVAVPRGTAT